MSKKLVYIGIITLLLFLSLGVQLTFATITTNKTTYDTGEDIKITYDVPLDAGYKNLFIGGYLPAIGDNYISQEDYFGGTIFEQFIYTNHVIFKYVSSLNSVTLPGSYSTFIQMPENKGVLITSISPAKSGDYLEFLGKARISFGSVGEYKDIYITSEQPRIIITDNGANATNIFNSDDLIYVNYFCKNTCSLSAIDLTQPDIPLYLFELSNLTTSDTGEWKTEVIDLSDSGYSENNYIEVTIEDENSNSSTDSFYIYTPQDIYIDVNTDIIYDVGTNNNGQDTFNNSLDVIYTTPYDGYSTASRILVTVDSVGTYQGELHEISTYPYNKIYHIDLQSGSITTGFKQFYASNPTLDNLSTNATIQMQKYEDTAPWYLPANWEWINAGSPKTINIRSYRENLNVILTGEQLDALVEVGKTNWDMIAVVDSFGLSGTFGHLLVSILVLGVTFYLIVIVLRLDAKVAIIFDGLELWYLVYAGFIDQLILVFLVLIVTLMYTSKLLKTLRGGQNPPVNEGG